MDNDKISTTKTTMPKHLEYIRSLPCCVCQLPAPSDAHHLRLLPGGHTMRGHDRNTVPLCRSCHTDGPNAVHSVGSKNEVAWFKSHWVDAEALVFKLWHDSTHQDTEHDKPPQRECKKTTKMRARAKPQQVRTLSIKTPLNAQNARHRQWPSQSIRSQGFGKQKRKINGRGFDGRPISYE